MAATTERPGRTGKRPLSTATAAAPIARIASAPRRRRPGLLAAGLALVAVGALVTVWLVNSAAHRVPVLVMARPVVAGVTVTDADVASADVSVDSAVATIPSSQRSLAVGRVARTDLVVGGLLSPGQLVDVGPPAVGQVLVVLALPATRLPASGLVPGTPILVVSTPPVDAETTANPPATIAATVVRVGSPDLNGVTPVDVSVPAGDGPALAARAATGRIAVVVRPRGQK